MTTDAMKMVGGHDGRSDERQATTSAILATHLSVRAVLRKLAMEPAGLDPATADLLVQLTRCSPEGIRGVDIGAQCHMSPTRVSRLLDRAEAAGLVERQPDPTDRRAQHVALTSAGRASAEAYLPLMHAALEELVFETLDEHERATLIELLARVRERATALLGTDAVLIEAS